MNVSSRSTTCKPVWQAIVALAMSVETEPQRLCSVCLEELGWRYPQRPNIGDTCIECVMKLEALAQKDGKEALDPTTRLPFRRCRCCREILTPFVSTFHCADGQRRKETELHPSTLPHCPFCPNPDTCTAQKFGPIEKSDEP